MSARPSSSVTVPAGYALAWLFRAMLPFCLVLAGLYAAPAVAEPVLPARASAPATPLLPYLDYYLDENGDMNIEEAAAPDHAAQYRPLALRSLPDASGVMWLRFTLGALPEGARPQTMLLDMGESIPGAPILYEPLKNDALGTMEWREVRPSQRNLLLLPEAGSTPLTCYLRLDGLPGIWFAPTLRSPQDAADNWGSLSRLGAILALGVVMLLCVLRAFSEKGQWRIWTALYVAAALAQALAGMPETGSGHVNMRQAASIMLPGIALMLLPHVGRHLMGTAQRSRSLDIQLLLLSLPGAALALLPLIPSWLWLARWLDLWPAGTLLFVPSGLAAWISGVHGSRRFLLGCLLPPLAVGVAVAGLDLGWQANLLASLPLWGVAASALVLATGAASQPEKSLSEAEDAKGALASIEAQADAPVINLERPLGSLDMPGNSAGADDAMPRLPDLDGLVPCPGKGDESFNLQSLLRRLHDRAAGQAEARGIGLAWYMPPQLDQCYRGDGHALAATLEALLENALSATKCGSIHLSVRRVPESGDPGNLLFTVSDSGKGMEGRSPEALANACAMAGESGGYVGMECGPNGATVAFTSRLGCLADWQSPSGEPLVIVLGETASMTRTLAHMLRNMPCRVRQAADFEEALEIQKTDPAILLIVEGAVASAAAGPEVRRFAELAHRAHLPLCKRLAITPDQSQWSELGKAGFTHALEEPVDDESLRATVAAILEKMREMQEEDARQASADHPAMTDQRSWDDVSPGEAGDAESADEGDASQSARESLAGAGQPADECSPDTDVVQQPDLTEAQPAPENAGQQKPEENSAQSTSDQATAQQSSTQEPPPPELLPWPGQPEAGESARQPHTPGLALPGGEMSGRGASASLAMPPAPASVGFPAIAPASETKDERLFRPDMAVFAGADTARTSADSALPQSEPAAQQATPDQAGRDSLASGERAPGGDESAHQEQPTENGHAVSKEQESSAAQGIELADQERPGAVPGIAQDSAGLNGQTPACPDVQNPDAACAGAAALGEHEAAEDSAPDSQSHAQQPGVQTSFMDLALAPPQPATASSQQGVVDTAPPASVAQEQASHADAPDTQKSMPQQPAAQAAHAEDSGTMKRPATAAGAEPARPTRQPLKTQSIAGTQLPYVSHHLGQPGEWVGEPMPIGTPIRHEATPGSAQEARASEDAPRENRTAAERKAQPVRKILPYESPSIRQPGEWVGEPMPIGTPITRHEKPENMAESADGQLVMGSRQDAPDASRKIAQTDGDSGNFLDFIAEPAKSAISVESEKPAADEMPAQGSGEAEKKGPSPIQALVTRLAETAMHVTARQEQARSEREQARSAPFQSAPAAKSQNALAEQPSQQAAPAAPADPTLAALVLDLDAAMTDANMAFKSGNPAPVALASSFIASNADEFGFRVLARMARCVEQAARAGDMGALGDLLPELASAVERNRIALSPKDKGQAR